MAIQQQQTGSGDLTLLQAIEMVAKDKGIDKGRLVKTVEEAILKAAQSVFGANRELEARFNEDTGQVDLFQYMTVVDDVATRNARSRSRRPGASGLEAEMGEELGFQIFWHAQTPSAPPSRTRTMATSCASSRRAPGVRSHRGADGQAGPHPARPRRRTRSHLQRVQGPKRANSSRGSSDGSRRATTSSSTSGAPRGFSLPRADAA